MSGRQAKRARREAGISIKARREEAAFDRRIEEARELRAYRAAADRRTRRALLAWAALMLIVATIGAALFL